MADSTQTPKAEFLSSEWESRTLENGYDQNFLRSCVSKAQQKKESLGRDLTTDEITKISQLHVYPASLVGDWVENEVPFKVNKLIDIGSGFGAFSRHLALQTGAEVCALEYLEKNHDDAKIFHSLCSDFKGPGSVDYLNQNFLDPLPEKWTGNCDAAIVIGVFLHMKIEERDLAAKRLKECLRPGGCFFINDYVANGEQDEVTRRMMHYEYFVPEGKLQTLEEYVSMLERNGLEVIATRDATSPYSELVWSRLQKWESGDEEIHETYKDRADSRETMIYKMRTFDKVKNKEDYPLALAQYLAEENKSKKFNTGMYHIIGRRPENSDQILLLLTDGRDS